MEFHVLVYLASKTIYPFVLVWNLLSAVVDPLVGVFTRFLGVIFWPARILLTTVCKAIVGFLTKTSVLRDIFIPIINGLTFIGRMFSYLSVLDPLLKAIGMLLAVSAIPYLAALVVATLTFVYTFCMSSLMDIFKIGWVFVFSNHHALPQFTTAWQGFKQSYQDINNSDHAAITKMALIAKSTVYMFAAGTINIAMRIGVILRHAAPSLVVGTFNIAKAFALSAGLQTLELFPFRILRSVWLFEEPEVDRQGNAIQESFDFEVDAAIDPWQARWRATENKFAGVGPADQLATINDLNRVELNLNQFQNEVRIPGNFILYDHASGQRRKTNICFDPQQHVQDAADSSSPSTSPILPAALGGNRATVL